MFSQRELLQLANIVQRHPQLTIISDEVYEHVVFDKVHSPHISFASLPGMFERTLTLSSSGKTFRYVMMYLCKNHFPILSWTYL